MPIFKVNKMARISSEKLDRLLQTVLIMHGFSKQNAKSLAEQTVLTEELGQSNAGVVRIFDYIEGSKNGRINGRAEPDVSHPAPSMIHVNGNGGLAQTGFDCVFDEIVLTAKKLGTCIFLHKNATTCGSLSSFVVRLADQGLVSFAATNGSPLLTGSGSTNPIFCTNPMAFSVPQFRGVPLIIDQSSSETAYSNIKAAAEKGEKIPVGWAMDQYGKPTTDPKTALEGSLLPFGGSRGANIALMVELLAAGLSGSNWSIDAPSFDSGDTCPGTGLFILAITPAPLDDSFTLRIRKYLERISKLFGVYLPGIKKGEARNKAAEQGLIIDDKLIKRLEEYS